MESFPVGEQVAIWGEWQLGEEALRLSTIPCPRHLFHLAVPELYHFIINWLSTK